MAPKPEKKLGEFLQEQQEPFILEVYLLERGCPKRWTSHSNLDNKKRKPLLPFSRVLRALRNKLASSPNQKTITPNEHVDVVETDRFSTASSSTVFNSCSDEDGTSSSSRKDNPSFSPHTCEASSTRLESQQATNDGKHHHGCVEAYPLPQTQNYSEGWNQHDSGGSCGVLVPKKITEESLLSAALWSLLIQSAKRERCGYRMEIGEMIGSNVKGVVHKTKQLLLDCVREITSSSSSSSSMGAEELGRIICQSQQAAAGDDKNLITYFLSLDYLDSIGEWSNYDQHVKPICVQIADSILDSVSYEIVSDMI